MGSVGAIGSDRTTKRERPRHPYQDVSSARM